MNLKECDLFKTGPFQTTPAHLFDRNLVYLPNLHNFPYNDFFAGFRAYLGMLRVDIYHNHPVLKAFVGILLDTHNNEKAHLNKCKLILRGSLCGNVLVM